jgi:hypothetical protein
VPKPLSKYTLLKRLIKHHQHKCQKEYGQNDCLKGMSKLPFNINVSELMSPHCRKKQSESANIEYKIEMIVENIVKNENVSNHVKLLSK